MRKKTFIIFFGLIIILSLVAVFLWGQIFDSSGQIQSEYSVTVAFPNLTFSSPVGIVSPGDGTNRLFVIEQQGTIRVFENSVNTATSKVFLDIVDRVLFGGEQGLLGLAFHTNSTRSTMSRKTLL